MSKFWMHIARGCWGFLTILPSSEDNITLCLFKSAKMRFVTRWKLGTPFDKINEYISHAKWYVTYRENYHKKVE